jgi:hypothetical protein
MCGRITATFEFSATGSTIPLQRHINFGLYFADVEHAEWFDDSGRKRTSIKNGTLLKTWWHRLLRVLLMYVPAVVVFCFAYSAPITSNKINIADMEELYG